jgi:tetratricopeptide (TPR) repeat protein
VKGNALDDARLLLKLGWIHGWMARYANALRWVRRGLSALDGVAGTDAEGKRAELLAWYAYFLQQEGRHAEAIRWCNVAVPQAERFGAKEALALAYKVLDWAAMDLGRLDEPESFRRALALYQELGDLPGQASILNMLGGHEYWHGRWGEALRLYEQARDIVTRTGNTVMQAFCTNNVGEILAEQGRSDEAEALFMDAFRVWRGAGFRSGFAYVKSNLARIASRAGRFEEAMELFEEARAESEELGAESDGLDTEARIAECWLLRGDAYRAAAVAEEALRHVAALGGVAPQSPALHRVVAYARMQTGDLAGGRASLEASLDAGRARKADYEIALTLQGLARLARLEGIHDIANEAESHAILNRLGVIAVPVIMVQPAGQPVARSSLPELRIAPG